MVESSNFTPKSTDNRKRDSRVQIFIKEKDGEFIIVGVQPGHDIYFLGNGDNLSDACEQAKQLAGKLGIDGDDIHVSGMNLWRFLRNQSAAKGGDADEFPRF